MKNIIGMYKNGNYIVTMLADGTKIRSTKFDDFIPNFAENCDVKITDKCDAGCPFCYEGCTVNGKHSKLMNEDGTPYWNFLNTLKPYTELALNGNDMTHPELIEFLKFLKTKKVFANLTVNQKHFTIYKDLLKQLMDDKLIWGLGISLNDSSDKSLFEFASNNSNVVIHTIAGILCEDDFNNMKEFNNLKILILGYKTLKRGLSYIESNNSSVEDNKNWLNKNLRVFVNTFKVISFDNLAIEQLNVKDTLFKDKQNEWDSFYMGDDGNFTFYIDLVKGEFSKNSCMPEDERFKIDQQYSVENMFNFIREKYKNVG